MNWDVTDTIDAIQEAYESVDRFTYKDLVRQNHILLSLYGVDEQRMKVLIDYYYLVVDEQWGPPARGDVAQYRSWMREAFDRAMKHCEDCWDNDEGA